MNHPKPEEWIELLYGETGNHARLARIKEHLRDCPDCQERFEILQNTRTQLQTWKVATPPAAKISAVGARFGFSPADLLRAAATVIVLVGMGFALGRQTGPSAADNARLRAEVTGQVQSQLKEFAALEAGQREAYQAALIKAIGRMEAKRALELATLRQDVEAVAVNTQDEFETTQEGLYELAAAEMPPQRSLTQ
ncbi:MAG: anti-sigma factor family protein [Limisphaerales bacterium]